MALGCAPLSEYTTRAEKGDKILKAEGWKDFRASGGHPAGSRLPFGPLDRFPHPNQGGNVSPDSAANSGRAGLTPPALAQRRRERQSYPGASGGPDSAANRAAGRADTPRWMAVASQNCPQLYQGESGGLEPSTKPVAGQAGAPLHSLSP